MTEAAPVPAKNRNEKYVNLNPTRSNIKERKPKMNDKNPIIVTIEFGCIFIDINFISCKYRQNHNFE